MSQQTLQLDCALQAYLHANALREPAACRTLRERTAGSDQAHLLSSPEQTQLLALLAALMGARRIVEVGTFVGYTPLWLALELGAQARIITLDRDADCARIAHAAWTHASVADRIEARLGEARLELQRLFDEDGAAHFDLAYIDADKENQLDYYEYCLKLVRPGGLVALDNVLWKGRVADAECNDATTEAVRAFNRFVHGDTRVDLALVPVGDGLTLVRRRDGAAG